MSKHAPQNAPQNALRDHSYKTSSSISDLSCSSDSVPHSSLVAYIIARNYCDIILPPMASAALKSFWNSPVGPKTSHFWGPMANWGFVLAVSFLTTNVALTHHPIPQAQSCRDDVP